MMSAQMSEGTVGTLAGSSVSVCLLTYNHAHIVASTIDSVLQQTIDGYEVIVSDDCSTDGTWDLVTRMAARDRRVRLVQTPRNLGMPGNANFAVRQARRPHIALLHHDDLYRSDLLERWQHVLADHPDVAYVFNAYAVHDSPHIYRHPLAGPRVDGRWFLEHHLLPTWWCPVRGTAMIRRDAWDAVGGMREEFGLLADIDLWMRLATVGAVGYVPEPLITVRQSRPADYPSTYGGQGWSWQRQRYLYEIHAQNRLSRLDRHDLRDRLAWWHFRARLSQETARWLLYAVARQRWPMLETSGESATPHDLLWLRALRALVRSAARLRV
jgi:glycosyltransferase involved in cell wall biosynthesis